MIKGKTETITVVTTEDFSTELRQYMVVNAAGAVTNSENDAVGIGVDRVRTNEHMTVDWMGEMKGRAGASIAKGAPIMMGATAGFLITAAGATRPAIGKALVAANSGDLFNFIGNFATVRVLA